MPKRLKYTGTGPVLLPGQLGHIKPGETTPDLPPDVYDGLSKRPDFKAVKSRKAATQEE